MKAKNAKRRASEFARCYHSKERVAWIKSQRCCMCSDVPCENAHYVGGGMGRKAGYETIIPLCAPHHRMLHRMGIASFEAYMGASPGSLARLAASTEQRWAAFSAGAE